jgi:hypothetical protein
LTGTAHSRGSATASPAVDRRANPAPVESSRLEWILFWAALAVYAVTRLVGITRFPIYFFCDEALQGNLAWQLLHNGFRDHTGTLLPPYFLNDRRWAVSLSAYANVIPTLLFGKSVAVVRSTSAAVTILGAAGAGLALRQMRNLFWWAAPLVIGITPLFFVHARLGFESAMMASFFFCFLWAYFVYRNGNPRWLAAAFFFGACTFYSYTAGQGVMLVTGLALLLSDLRFHLRQPRRWMAAVLLLAVVLALPYLRYRRLHPGVVREQLQVLDSYWIKPIPLSEKLAHFGRNYAAGLDPRYWFLENDREMERHRMGELPFLPPFLAPLIALGIAVCLWRVREPLHRAVLLSPLGVPFSGAAANIQILRLLAVIVPATLFAAIGIDRVLRWLAKLRLPPLAAGAACAAALAAGNVVLLRDALRYGPTWSKDYGLYGMQWGAPQVFRAIKDELAKSPDSRIFVSSTWSNNPAEFVRFFLTAEEEKRVAIADIRAWDQRLSPLEGNEVFVMTPDEYALAKGRRIFTVPEPIRTIFYPDGRPGFRFVRVRYSADAPEIFQEERRARSVLKEETTAVGGEIWTIRHSVADMGSVPDLFDGRPDSLLRGLEANPFVIEIVFPSLRNVKGVALSLGGMDLAHLRVRAAPESGGEEVEGDRDVPNRPPRDTIDVPLARGPVRTSRIRIEIADGNGTDPTHIEVREVRVR